MRVLPAAVVCLAALGACSTDDAGKPKGSGSGTDNPGVPTNCAEGTHGVTAAILRITLSEFDTVIGDVVGTTPRKSFADGYGKSATGFSTEPALNAVGEQTVEKIMSAAEEVARALPDRIGKILPCAADGDEACAKTYLET